MTTSICSILKIVFCEFIFFRSGSSLTGKLLSQGLKVPNYVYEPMAYFRGKDLDERQITPQLKTELMSVFETGKPKNSSFNAHISTRGINITEGGDVITKTIRLRYKHLRGWIEEQETIKADAYRLFLS